MAECFGTLSLMSPTYFLRFLVFYETDYSRYNLMAAKTYGSIVRNNLMNEKHYTPYCGSDNCTYGEPRTRWMQGQFMCPCGWRSEFDSDFIKEYRKKWKK